MHLVITEKNDAAKKIAELLANGLATVDKVYDTPVYRFQRDDAEWVAIGLRGHILALDFPIQLIYRKSRGWSALDEHGELLAASIPDGLAKPPFKKRKPFLEDGVDLKGWKLDALPYLVYSPLVKTPAEKGIIRSLKNLAAKAESVVIATDYDREGELIGADALAIVREVAPDIPATRARYSAFSKAEISQAFAGLSELDFALAAAGESRQWIDLIWGAVLTRYLTLARLSGFGRVRPSGRVQTPTLALIVAREDERRAFVPEDYWLVKGRFDAACERFEASAAAVGDDSNGQAFEAGHAKDRFKVEAEAAAVMQQIEGADTATVSTIETKQRRVPPPTPFNTTALQAAAAAEGLNPGRCMRIAESLYMAGLISYPRVDNTVYPASLDFKDSLRMLAAVPVYAAYAQQLLKQPQLKATRGKTETTDHPPIYPTGAGDMDRLRPEEWKLYNLVARRFMATLSAAAVVEGTKVGLDVAGEVFVARGDVLVSPGFRGIYPYGLKKDEQLPRLQTGQQIAFCGATMEHKQTEPPARYSQGRLIQQMEKLGLGTKSTRASIIERLIEVRYVVGDPLEPTALGQAVAEALGRFAPPITTPEMTANLEEEMSSIAAGGSDRDAVVGHSRRLLADIMEELIPAKDEVGEALSDAVTADARVGACPACGKDLLLKSSAKTRGNFIGCSGWPECEVTYPVPQGRIESVEELCPTCGKPQVKVTPFRSKPLLHCVDPLCTTNFEPDLPIGSCPTCAAAGQEGGVLIAQKNPRTLKRFVRCTNYETCDTSYPLPQRGKLTATDKVCEACGAPHVVVQTYRGPWELCPNPNCPQNLERAEAKAAAKPKAKAAAKPKAKAAAKPKAKAAAKPAAKAAAKPKAASKTASKAKTAAKPKVAANDQAADEAPSADMA
ncbi:MAG: DNA topoisomerase I [Actinomycetia bacterium]|nr:DNA topoisomerase I [Actinomycetes bacterium]